MRVVGIDVGGQKKGFHAVALENGVYLDRKNTKSVSDLVDWCCNKIAVRVVAVDSPCRWSIDGHARPAEKKLMVKGIFCFSTPTRKNAVEHPTDYYGWMLRGERLFKALEPTHPLCVDRPPRRNRFCFETFPHAITWHLRGGNAKASLKRKQRSELLHKAGIELGGPVGIDTIDAALCALTAHLVAVGGKCSVYGEAKTGFIIVPMPKAWEKQGSKPAT